MKTTKAMCRVCGVVVTADALYSPSIDTTTICPHTHRAKCGQWCINSNPVDLTDKSLHTETHCGAKDCNGGT